MITEKSSKGKIRQAIGKFMEKLHSQGLGREADKVLMDWVPSVIERHGGIPADMQDIVMASNGWPSVKAPVSSAEFYELYAALKAIDEGRTPTVAPPLGGKTARIVDSDSEDEVADKARISELLKELCTELNFEEPAKALMGAFPGMIIERLGGVDKLTPLPADHPTQKEIPGVVCYQPPYKELIVELEDMKKWREEQLLIFADCKRYHDQLIQQGRAYEFDVVMKELITEAEEGKHESAKYFQRIQWESGSESHKLNSEAIRDKLKARVEQLH